MQNTILKFLYGALVIATVSTTGAAVTKISAGHQTAKAETTVAAKNQAISSISEKTDANEKPGRANLPVQKLAQANFQNELDDNGNSEKSKSPKTAPQIQVTSTTQNSASNTNIFTISQLATHNTSNSCYIAQNGTVYDITNVAVWAGCAHHGATGGIDITPIFPHPISYLNNLNKIGILISDSTTTSTSTIQSSGQITQSSQNNSKIKDHDRDEDKFEHEDND